jgi:hypothetical protein
MERYRETISADLKRFLEEELCVPLPLRNPMVGLGMALEVAFHSHVSALLNGEPEPRAIRYCLAYFVPRAPEVHLNFDTVPGEDVWQALQRFERFKQKLKAV